MNADKLARTTFVLDRATHDQLSYISGRLGVSRSTLVRDTLAQPIAMMERWMRSVPENATPADAARLFALMEQDLSAFAASKADALGSVQ